MASANRFTRAAQIPEGDVPLPGIWGDYDLRV